MPSIEYGGCPTGGSRASLTCTTSFAAEDENDEAEAEGPDMNVDFFEMPINETKH